jgi:protein tyrosine phosphatase
MVNPNKYIRKAIFDAVNATYPCFDTQVTGKKNPLQYVIISTQDKDIDKANKCNYRWEVSTLLDIVCIYNGVGNVGSRLANDDMENTIMTLIENIQITGYTVINRRYEFPSNLDSSSSTQTVYRNFIRIVLTLQ